MAIVGDLNELETTVFNGDVNGGRAGVEAVLDELFDRGHRPLDDLAGGDSVDDRLVEAVDFGRVSGDSLLFFIHFHFVEVCELLARYDSATALSLLLRILFLFCSSRQNARAVQTLY